MVNPVPRKFGVLYLITINLMLNTLNVENDPLTLKVSAAFLFTVEMP